MHAGRHLAEAGVGRSNLLSLNLFLFVLAGFAFSTDLRRGGNKGWPDLGGGHAHHLLGDTVGFVLQRVVDFSDCELGLQKAGRGWRFARHGWFSLAFSVRRKDRDSAEIP